METCDASSSTLLITYTGLKAGDVVEVTDLSAQTDISIAGTYTINNDGGGEIYLTFKGTPTITGTRYISFQIAVGEDIWSVYDAEISVDEFDKTAYDLSLKEMTVKAIIMQGGLDIREDESELIIPGDDWADNWESSVSSGTEAKRRLVVYYNNGWVVK